jgi:NAD(P)-dependent dehydrogenase (short-subunit alcohol dehydrogenase family)
MSPDAVRLEMEAHFFGTLTVSRAFAPQIAANGGGAILNVREVVSAGGVAAIYPHLP